MKPSQETNISPAFTLIETLLTLSLFLLVFGGLLGTIASLYKAHSFTLQQAQASNEARRAVKEFVREIREARQGDDGSYILEKADDQEIIFYSDIDKDDQTERVRYFLDGDKIKKGITKPQGNPLQYNPSQEQITDVIHFVRNGQEPIFYYYNGDWPADAANNPLPTPSRLKETKLIKIYLKLNVDPHKLPKSYELSSEVQIRNLKTNL